MTNNKKLIRLIFFIFIILIVITVGLVIYSLDNNRITPYASGTQVGYVYIGGKNTWQAEEELTNKINEWKNPDYATIQISYQNNAYRIPIPTDIFEFDIEGSIQAVKSDDIMNYENGINVIKVDYADDKQNFIENELAKHYTKLKFSDFDLDALKADILKYVSFLYKEIYLDLGNYINQDKIKTTKVNDSQDIIYPNAAQFRLRYNEIFREMIETTGDMIEIEPKSQFSLNEFLIQYYKKQKPQLKDIEDVQTVYDLELNVFTPEELNVLATGIYQTILYTNFMNISKEISDQLPSGFLVAAGYEATSVIDYEYTTKNQLGEDHQYHDMVTDVEFKNLKDLSFYNPNDYSYYISIKNTTNQSGDKVLSFQLYGAPFINSYEPVEKVLEGKRIIAQDTVIWYEKTWEGQELNPGDEIDYNKGGYPGYHSRIAIKTTIMYPLENQDTIVYKLISEDYYMPENAIIIKYDNTSE